MCDTKIFLFCAQTYAHLYPRTSYHWSPSSLSSRPLTRMQGNGSLSRITNILTPRHFSSHTKHTHITSCAAHYPLERIFLSCCLSGSPVNVDFQLASRNSADPSINQLQTFLSYCSWSYRVFYKTIGESKVNLPLLVDDMQVCSWPLILRRFNPRRTNSTLQWTDWYQTNFMF